MIYNVLEVTCVCMCVCVTDMRENLEVAKHAVIIKKD